MEPSAAQDAEEWKTIMISKLWNDLLNKEDRPATPNEGGQYPMCTIYDDDTLCLAHYLGFGEFCGTSVLGKMSFGTFEKHENTLFWGLAPLNRVVKILNQKLESHGYKIKVVSN